MKSRQRFFNASVLRKDLSRFAPVWLLYLIGGLMMAVNPLIGHEGLDNLTRAVDRLGEYLGVFSVINLVYGSVVAMLLFGDLFNGRLCNALHAMPLRREGWFATHILAGLLFSLIPNFIGSLAFMPFLREFWYVALLWLLGMTLEYLFFFGAAVLAMHCTGSRFAAFVICGIFNFGVLLVLWLADTVYVPLLYGVRLDNQAFMQFLPVVQLLDMRFLSLSHSAACGCGRHEGGNYLLAFPDYAHEYVLHFWPGWGYAAILAAVGIACIAVALLLYRRRRLETAGSFVAFRPLRPVFQLIFSLSVAGFCYLLPELLFGGDEGFMLVFFFIGLVIGFFVSQMFMDRTVKVFQGKAFLRLGLLVLALVLSVALTWLDPLGITRYVPPADQVEAVYLGKYYTNNWNTEDIDSSDACRITDPATIEEVRQAHMLMYQERDAEQTTGYGIRSYTIHYKLKNGQTLTRSYAIDMGGPVHEKLVGIMSKPQVVLGVDSLEQLQAQTVKIVNMEHDYTLSPAILPVLWQDLQDGKLVQDYWYHTSVHKENVYNNNLRLELRDPATGKERTVYLDVYPCCKTLELLELSLRPAPPGRCIRPGF